MVWLQQLHYRARTLFGRDALERALDDELQFHLEMQTSANINLGMSPLAARTLAERQFGGLSQHKDAYRDRWGARQFETLWQDARGAVRHAWSHRGVSLAVILVLALGIGVGTAVFNVLYAVAINPLPLNEPGRLMRLQAFEAPEHRERLLSAPEVRDLRAGMRTLDAVAEFHYMYFILLDRDEPQRVSAGVVSSNFFDVIGVTPMRGRTFTAAEEQPGADGVIIVSYRYWKNQLKGDPQILGRVFQMNDRAHKVVGVLPPLPSFPEEADIYLPTAACPLRISHEGDTSRSMHLVSVLGRVSRLYEGDTSAVQNELTSLTSRVGVAESYDAPPAFSAVPVHDDLTGRFRPTLSVLVASTVFLLLSLCLSVGGLMVANTLRRRDSLLLMTALGAWRGRLFRQFASEALLLSTLGAVLGVGLASQTVPLLAGLASRFTPRAVEIQFDQTSLWFAAGVTLVISLLIGTIVALTAGSTLTSTDGLGHRRYVSTRPRLFKTLVVVHIAVSFALLVGAGLMLRSLVNLERIKTGFNAGDVLTLRLSSDFIEYPQPSMQAALFHRLLATIKGLPEVTSVGMSGAMPLAGSGNVGEETFEIAGRLSSAPASRPLASLQNVSAGYFSTVGLDIVEGRGFSDDEGAAESVVIISEGMARRYWPGGGAVGERIRAGKGPWATVVGVASDARQRLAEPPMDEIYRPINQMPLFGFISPQIRYMVRGTVPHDQLAERIRTALREVAPQHAVDNIGSLSRAREFSLAPMRTTTMLIVLFAGIALSISTIGLCGVAGASVSARTHAIGLQMALGATRWRLWRGVLREGVVLSLAGLGIGVVLAVPLARSLGGLLFEVAPNDAATFVAVGILLMTATMAGCLAPARRAALVDPNTALRA